MISILLLILKIIGIIILCILGFLLLTLLIVLFVPIRYRLNIDKPLNTMDDFKAEFKISWFLGLVRVIGSYKKEFLVRAYILFFKVYPKKERKKAISKISKLKKHEDDIEEVRPINSSSVINDFTNNNDVTVDNDIIINDDLKNDESIEVLADVEDCVEDSIAKNIEDKIDDAKYNDKKVKNKDNIFKKFKDFIENISLKKAMLYDKIKAASNNIEYYKGVINSKAFKKSFSLCKKQLKKIVRMIKPRKISGYLNVGFKEPSTTAEIFGIYAILLPYLGRNFNLYPNLQEEVFNGRIKIAGRIQIITLVIVGLKIFFNKDIRCTLKMFKKESE